MDFNFMTVGLFDRMTDTVWLADCRKDCEQLTDESKRRKVFSELLKLQKAMIRYKNIFASNKDFIDALEEVIDILLRGFVLRLNICNNN